MIRSVIIGTGSYIPEVVVSNKAFEKTQFFGKDKTKFYRSSKSIIEKFQDITGIKERRYAKPEQAASDLAVFAAKDALDNAGIDKESLDYLIVAHNFGDVGYQSNRISMVPTLASRVKAHLKIHNVDCIAYDLPFGCPGWIEGVIQASYFIRSGDAKRCLVIATETLSRVIDPHDRDSMIYGDGAAAVVVEASHSKIKGMIGHKTQSHTIKDAYLLNTDHSYSQFVDDTNDIYIKMNGRKVYEFAISNVPPLIKAMLDKANLTIDDISKVLIHQANDKMDQAIIDRLFKLYGKDTSPPEIMPMTISWLGNSSVATVPTLLDLIRKRKLDGHEIREGDKVVMASVGAGMNINALVYQF